MSGIVVVRAATAGGGVTGNAATSRVVLPGDVANSTVTLADVTGLQFAMLANTTYWFRVFIDFTADLATTGSRWGFTGPAGLVRAVGRVWTTNAAGGRDEWTQVDYSINVNASATSVVSRANATYMDGTVKNGGTAGNLKAQFASEVGGGVITALAGTSYVEFGTIA